MGRRLGDVVTPVQQSANLRVSDQDHFKAINDTFGHAAGDTVLAATAARLTTWAGPHAAIGRLGAMSSRSSWRRPAAAARTASQGS
ncbi:diguanylate cyclase domain-containing protein [Streptomyces sp. CB01635]|uniref:diguanylate cyclase domain-containing protein n=1 Tax=Streptomyces sp. CB01635 TaxID=2020326 RepID=UPI0026783F41